LQQLVRNDVSGIALFVANRHIDVNNVVPVA
jgi:hypothetical protein